MPGTGENGSSSSAALANNLFAHAAEKGGQKNIDREKINSIVMELTGDSKFTLERLEHHGVAQKWVSEAKRKLATFDRTQRSVVAHHVSVQEAKLEAKRQHHDRKGRCCCVVDFDMFYAAVELRDRPDLQDKPVAVGGPSMIATANYVARKWGVRSAMPGWIGAELCRRGPEFGMPKADLIFVPTDFEKYTAVAKIARDIFAEYDPTLRAYSLDEAYIDLTMYLRVRSRHPNSHDVASCHLSKQRCKNGSRKTISSWGVEARHKAEIGDEGNDELIHDEDERDDDFDTGLGCGDEKCEYPMLDLEHDQSAASLAELVLTEIRARVRNATGGLTLSGGLGPNFMLAKIAADVNKPNGQFRVATGRKAVLDFLCDLPCRKVSGIGRVLELKLSEGLNVNTVGKLRANMLECWHCFTPKAREFLLRVSIGASCEGDDETGGDSEGNDDDTAETPKGLGNERTFPCISAPDALRAKLEEICSIVAKRLAERGLRASKLSLKIKRDDFHVSTRDWTASHPRGTQGEGGPVGGTSQYFQDAESLVTRAWPLLDDEIRKAGGALPLRLMGVRTSGFEIHGAAARPPGQRGIKDTFAAMEKRSEILAESAAAPASASRKPSVIDIDDDDNEAALAIDDDIAFTKNLQVTQARHVQQAAYIKHLAPEIATKRSQSVMLSGASLDHFWGPSKRSAVGPVQVAKAPATSAQNAKLAQLREILPGQPVEVLRIALESAHGDTSAAIESLLCHGPQNAHRKA